MQSIDPAIGDLLAVALALIFGASGVLKVRDSDAFAGAVANYRLLPAWAEPPFARALPLAECACAAGLLFGATRAASAIGLIALLGLFTGAITINLLRGRTDIDCGCFGPALRQPLSGWLLARNAALMIIAVAVALPASARDLQGLDRITIGLGAATLTILYVSANYAIGNLPRTRELEMI
jgi:methylamine utilization protein MauE